MSKQNAARLPTKYGRWGGCAAALALFALHCGERSQPEPPRLIDSLVGKKVVDIAVSRAAGSLGIMTLIEGEGVSSFSGSSADYALQPLPFDAARVQSLADGSCALYGDASAHCLGMYGPLLIATDAGQVVQLFESGGGLLCVLGRSGTVRCGPQPQEGQSFTGIALDTGGLTITQLAGSENTLCGRAAPDVVRCWTLQGESGAASGAARDFRGLAGISQLAVYADSACAVLGDGRVSCWKTTEETTSCGSLTTSPSLMSGLADIVEVQLGDCRGCARKRDGGVLCWGQSGLFADRPNMFGDVPTPLSGVPPARKLVMGSVWVGEDCLLSSGGEVYCWGGYTTTGGGGGCGPVFFIPGR